MFITDTRLIFETLVDLAHPGRRCVCRQRLQVAAGTTRHCAARARLGTAPQGHARITRQAWVAHRDSGLTTRANTFTTLSLESNSC